MTCSRFGTRVLVVFALSIVSGAVRADEGVDAGSGPPTHTGRDRVSAAIGQQGATMELGNGAKIELPAGLPIGNSRVMAFATARSAPRPADVAPGFVRFGPALSFDGAINATDRPLVVSARARTYRARPGHRLVLAVEIAGLCTDANRRSPLGQGLCSTWELVDATHDAAAQRVRAELRAPGGYRLQLGWVPIAAASQ